MCDGIHCPNFHCLTIVYDVCCDGGSVTGGYSPPPESEYARDGVTMRMMSVVSFQSHLIQIRLPAKSNAWKNGHGMTLCGGSTPPEPVYARAKRTDGGVTQAIDDDRRLTASDNSPLQKPTGE